MFARLGRWCYRRRIVVVALWVAVAVVGGGVLGAVGTRTVTEFSLPEVESRRGIDIFEEHFDGQGAGQSAPIVFQADDGIDAPEVEAAMTEVFAFVEHLGVQGDEARESGGVVLDWAAQLGLAGDDVDEAVGVVESWVAGSAEVDHDDARDALETLLDEADEVAEPGDQLGDVDDRIALGVARAFAADADVDRTVDESGRVSGAIRVVSPYTPEGQRQIVPPDEELAGLLAYGDVELPPNTSFEESQAIGKDIRDILPELDGLHVAVGGEMFAEFEEPTAEIIGVAFAIIILIVAFGSVIAMGLPIGVGLAGIGVGTIAALFLTHVFEVPEFAQMLGIMIGLGVGIDYALFIVTRFRENRRAGQSIEQSIVVAINTAGRAVMFAGMTVVISLLGMLIMQLGFVTGMAVSAATVVAVTMVASLTLLPALIGFVGERIEVTRRRGILAAGGISLALLGVGFAVPALTLVGLIFSAAVLVTAFAVAPLRKELPPRKQRPTEQTTAYRWSRVIQRNPWPAALVGVVVLVALALPVFGMRLGFADEGNYPTDTDTRQAYDMLADGFGAGYNGPLLLAAELPEGGVDEGVLLAVTAALNDQEGRIADVVPSSDAPPEAQIMFNDPADPTAVQWLVFPETSPQDVATTDLVNDLRSEILPAAVGDSGLDIAVSGGVAVGVDFTEYLGERLVFFFAAVLTLSFILLMVVFRSILVPLKAVIMNLLGIGAAYGVIIAGFQWGWLGPVLGIDSGPIEPFMPMMLFAIVFGLSMDYEVFLLSRIKEDYDRTGDSHTSVANGLASTARVITAAAMIMIVVFGAFSLGDERVLKMAGIGLGVAVFLDATIIRMLLVPATMELLGDRNWWLPGWLDRLLPTIDVEGHGVADEDETDDRDRDRELQTVV